MKISIFWFVTVLFLFISIPLMASSNDQEPSEHHSDTKDSARVEKFDPGKFIIEHISDSHEWHIITLPSGKPVSIPLPIIVYSKTRGLNAFFSSRFHHGHSIYKGFKYELEGELKGKITEENAVGIFTPVFFDFSITKVVAGILISITILLLVFLGVARRYKKYPGIAPQGTQSFMEPIILFIRDDVAKPAIGSHKFEKYVPYLLTVFFFILINNLVGLIPCFPFGVNVTGNIAVTLVLAIFTFIITTLNGNKNYWKEIYNAPGVPWWLKFPIPLMPVVELIGVFTKPFVLMIRLFANISAGHIVALGFMSLIFIFGSISVWIGYGVSIISVLFAVFMILLDVLVSFIQAYVFTLLSALYFGMATAEHHHETEHHHE